MCDKRKLSEEDNDSQDSDRACGIQDTNSRIANSDKTLVEKKIRKIIEQHFDEEIDYKRHELEKINERIFEAQNMLDKLRVCIVCNFYSSNGQIALNDYINHPAVASLRCEHLEAAITHSKSLYEPGTKNESNEAHEDSNRSSHHQFDSKICVGNVSKYLNNKKIDSQLLQNDVESSQYNQDLITHKWMIYIRSPNCPKLDNYIKKVIFYLHPSYKPYDVVEVKTAPFQLARRGWGEFPVHVQIHFKDERNKRVDISHNLKLDWTQTGLQTFGDSDIITKTKKPEVSQNSQTKEETPSESLQDQLNSQYQIELFKSDSQTLPRNFSSSSLSSTSNSNVFSPFINQNLTTNPSPTNFISTDPETPSTPNTSSFDEVFQNLNKKEEIQNGAKSSSTSLDALLSLRPKGIQLAKPLSSNLVLSTKSITSNQLASNNNSQNNSDFLKNLNKKLVIFKVGSDNAKSNEADSEKTNFFPKSQLAFTSTICSKKFKVSNEQLTKINKNSTQNNSDHNENASKLDNFYSSHLLIEKIKNLNLKKKKITFENLLNESIRLYPIIGDRCQKGRSLPFSAQSIHEFYSWPYAKRRANEWIRALYIKKRCLYLMEKYDLKKVSPWSTKSIVLWLRSHGYTPLEYQHMQIMSLDRKIISYDENQAMQEFHYVDSLLPVNFIKPDDFWKVYSQHETDQVLVDVENTDPSEHRNSKANLRKKIDQELFVGQKNHIEPCTETRYVHELLEQLNLKTCLVNIAASHDQRADESNVFTCDLTERFLFRLAKRFAEDLIRQTCSDVYFDSARSDRFIESAKRNGPVPELSAGCQKFSDYLNVVDIFRTINKHEKYDFLTNKYMARPSKCYH